MAEYFSVDDLKFGTDPAFLIQVSDDNEDGQPDDGVLIWARDKAQGIIDSYLQVLYTIPLITIPLLIQQLGVFIAIYLLASRRRIVEELVRTNYTDAISTLEKIAEGKIKLGVDSEDEVVPDASSAPVIANKTAEDQVFSLANLNATFPRRGF